MDRERQEKIDRIAYAAFSEGGSSLAGLELLLEAALETLADVRQLRTEEGVLPKALAWVVELVSAARWQVHFRLITELQVAVTEKMQRSGTDPISPGLQLDPQRAFSVAQKREIYLRGDGHCQACGQPLDSDWHADHILPHSRGGRTDIINGQSLCQPCNSRKHDKVLSIDLGP
ncbi:MAG: HNH endonuclease [Blastocatellia bacterium]|nr:HNH endonuclease [Blastocatellia bacterium]